MWLGGNSRLRRRTCRPPAVCDSCGRFLMTLAGTLKGCALARTQFPRATEATAAPAAAGDQRAADSANSRFTAYVMMRCSIYAHQSPGWRSSSCKGVLQSLLMQMEEHQTPAAGDAHLLMTRL